MRILFASQHFSTSPHRYTNRNHCRTLSSSTLLPTIPTHLPCVHYISLRFPFSRLTTRPFASLFLSIGFSKPSGKITATSMFYVIRLCAEDSICFQYSQGENYTTNPWYIRAYHIDAGSSQACRPSSPADKSSTPVTWLHRQVDLHGLDKYIEQVVIDSYDSTGQSSMMLKTTSLLCDSFPSTSPHRHPHSRRPKVVNVHAGNVRIPRASSAMSGRKTSLSCRERSQLETRWNGR